MKYIIKYTPQKYTAFQSRYVTYKLHFWCVGTLLEYRDQVHMSRSSDQGQGQRNRYVIYECK